MTNQECRQQLVEAKEKLRKSTDDCEHLIDILTNTAKKEWNYTYLRIRIIKNREWLQEK